MRINSRIHLIVQLFLLVIFVKCLLFFKVLFFLQWYVRIDTLNGPKKTISEPLDIKWLWNSVYKSSKNSWKRNNECVSSGMQRWNLPDFSKYPQSVYFTSILYYESLMQRAKRIGGKLSKLERLSKLFIYSQVSKLLSSSSPMTKTFMRRFWKVSSPGKLTSETN